MKILAPALCAFISGAVSAAAQQPFQPAGPPAIVTTGEGVVRHAPDLAWVTIGAETRARTPHEAQQANVDAMNGVVARIKEAGIPADAIQTAGYTLQPEFDFQNGKQSLRDYVARNQVRVRVDTLAKTGDVIGAAAGAGMQIDRILRIEEQRDFLPMPRAMMTVGAGGGMRADASVPIEAGEIEIHARVTLTVGIH